MAPTTRNSLFELPVRRQGTIQRVAKLRTRHRAGSTERGRGLPILRVTGVVRDWLYQFGGGAAPQVGKTNGGRRPSILGTTGGLLGSIVAARGGRLGIILGSLGSSWQPFWRSGGSPGLHFWGSGALLGAWAPPLAAQGGQSQIFPLFCIPFWNHFGHILEVETDENSDQIFD